MHVTKGRRKYLMCFSLAGNVDGSAGAWRHLPTLMCFEWRPKWYPGMFCASNKTHQLPSGSEGQEWDHGHWGVLEPLPGRPQPWKGPQCSHPHCCSDMQSSDRDWPFGVHNLVMLWILVLWWPIRPRVCGESGGGRRECIQQGGREGCQCMRGRRMCRSGWYVLSSFLICLVVVVTGSLQHK